MPTILEFSTDDLAQITGLTGPQAHRLCAVGAFGEANRRPGSGGRRRYSRDDLRIGLVLAELGRVSGILLGQVPSLGHALALDVASALRHADPDNRFLVVDVEGAHVQAAPWTTHPSVLIHLAPIDEQLDEALRRLA